MKNVMPEGQGKRTSRRLRHDLIPIQWLDMLALIFEEGLPKYGDSWKKGGKDFLIDCLNHASNHFHRFCSGDFNVKHLWKTAWNVLAVAYHLSINYQEVIIYLKEKGDKLDEIKREDPSPLDRRQEPRLITGQ